MEVLANMCPALWRIAPGPVLKSTMATFLPGLSGRQSSAGQEARRVTGSAPRWTAEVRALSQESEAWDPT